MGSIKNDQDSVIEVETCGRRSISNVNRRDLITTASAEFTGTSILVFLGCLGCVHAENQDNSLLYSSLLGGLTVAAILHIFTHISGAYINPAINLAALIIGEIPFIKFIVYTFAQLLGSLAGYALFKVLTPMVYTSPAARGVTFPSRDVSTLQALSIEVIITSFLALANCSSWDERNSNRTDSGCLKIGLIVTVLSLAAGPYTGAVMNPARSFAPAVFNLHFTDHWIYWVGPLIGAAKAAISYRLFYKQ